MNWYKKADLIPGGLAEGKKPSEFDPKQLARGVAVELEHTNSRAVAREVVGNHLTEDPLYYEKLEECGNSEEH